MRGATFIRHHGAWRDQVIGVLLALCIVAVVTVSLMAASLWLPIEHVTIVYLIPVIVAALRWGAIPALFAGVSGLAAPAYFFYAPIYDFRVHSPAQLVDMMMFVTVAAITGRMAVTVRHAQDACAGGKPARRADRLGVARIAHAARRDHRIDLGSGAVARRSSRTSTLSSLVRVVRNEAERLNGDIQNLLDATRISSDGIMPHWEWVDPEDIVSGALARKRQLLAGPQDRARRRGRPAAGLCRSFADRKRARPVDRERGEIFARRHADLRQRRAERQHDPRSRSRTRAKGLPTGEAERIFERFYRSPRHAQQRPGLRPRTVDRARADRSLRRTHPRVQQRPGHGTTLSIDLPVKPQPASDEDADE